MENNNRLKCGNLPGYFTVRVVLNPPGSSLKGSRGRDFSWNGLFLSAMNIEMKMFTEKQGQYLAFIYNYSKIHGCAPSEADLQSYFRVTPPTVHQMILKLEEKRLISRVPGQPRSIRLLIPPEQLPILK